MPFPSKATKNNYPPMLTEVRLNHPADNFQVGLSHCHVLLMLKEVFEVLEPQLDNLSGLSFQTLVLCNNTCSRSWINGNLADRLGLYGRKHNIAVSCINTEDVKT